MEESMQGELCGASPEGKCRILYNTSSGKPASTGVFALFAELASRSDMKAEHIWAMPEGLEASEGQIESYGPTSAFTVVTNPSGAFSEALDSATVIVSDAALPASWAKRPGQTLVHVWDGVVPGKAGYHNKRVRPRTLALMQRELVLADYLVVSSPELAADIFESYDIDAYGEAFCPRPVTFGSLRADLLAKRNTAYERGQSWADGWDHSNRLIVCAFNPPRSILRNGRAYAAYRDALAEIERTSPDGFHMVYLLPEWARDLVESEGSSASRTVAQDVQDVQLFAAADAFIVDRGGASTDCLARNVPVAFIEPRPSQEASPTIDVGDREMEVGAACEKVEDAFEYLRKALGGDDAIADMRAEAVAVLFGSADDNLSGQNAKRAVDFLEGCKWEPKPVSALDAGRRKRLVIGADRVGDEGQDMLLYRLLRGIDEDEYDVTVLTADVRPIREECCRSCPAVKFRYFTVDSSVALSDYFAGVTPEGDEIELRHVGKGKASDAVQDDASSQGLGAELEAERSQLLHTLLPGVAADRYLNVKASESLVDRLFLGCSGVNETQWMFSWFVSSDPEKLTRMSSHYDEAHLFCFDIDKIPKELRSSSFELHDAQGIREHSRGRYSVLIVASYDSVNYALSTIALELKKRGHQVTVISENAATHSGNRMFAENGIEVQPLKGFRNAALNYIDFAFIPPFRNKNLESLYNGIRYRSIMTFAFANLFSSIVMRVYPDVVFAISEGKIEEFSENYLKYCCIVAGNPQYDRIIGTKSDVALDKIKDVLFIEQGGYPYGDVGRRQLAGTLIRLAKSNPDMTIHVRPRYLPDDVESAVHKLSRHLYEYLDERPDNLVLQTSYANLEDSIADYDAMLVMWSTAYLDALIADMPVLFMKGFDSEDVFDVRTVRIQEAYDHLEATGCVYDYRELDDLHGKFKRIDADYARYDAYRHDEPSVTRIVDFIDFCYEHLICKDLRLAKPVNCTTDQFFEQFDTFELRSASSATHAVSMRYLDAVNSRMQDFVYQNRCMGNVLDLEPLQKYYDISFDDIKQAYIPTVKFYSKQMARKMNEEFEDLRTQYFTDPEKLPILAEDAILQDYYFDWANKNDIFDVLDNPPFEVKAPESREINLARWYRKQGDLKRAYEHMIGYLRIASRAEVIKFRKSATIEATLRAFRERKLRYHASMIRHADAAMVEFAESHHPEKSLLASWLILRDLDRKGMLEKASEYYRLFSSSRKKPKGGTGVVAKAKTLAKGVFFNMVSRRGERAARKLANQQKGKRR